MPHRAPQPGIRGTSLRRSDCPQAEERKKQILPGWQDRSLPRFVNVLVILQESRGPLNERLATCQRPGSPFPEALTSLSPPRH